ncbi:MAG TPA: OpgC domain-containing protein [Candidatus Saccharimonadales bacterium]|nr:OpgC domain-containing protein [Candidatus Saccharimonadales bacterium]
MAQVTERDFTIGAKVPKTQRILTLDLLRGFFLLVIMIDHIELYPNLWDFFTGKGRLWVSAAEGFFFMSGLLIGMMYKRRLHLGMKFIFRKMWTRAAQLYLVGVGFTLLYVSWVVFTHHAPVKDSLPLPFPWHHYLVQALLMRFTYGWADFLVRFALLMFAAPFVFYLLSKGKWWLAFAGIWAAWVLRGQGFTLAWQLIFNMGIIIGYYWQPMQQRFRKLSAGRQKLIKRSFLTAGLATFIFSYASVYVLSLLFFLWGDNHLPHYWQHVAFTWGWLNHDIWNWADKWTMGPLRIALFFIWFPVLYAIVRRYEQRLEHISHGIIEALGRNSLFVYSVHSVIVFTLKMYFIPPTTNLLQNFLITGSGLVALVLITKLYIRYRPALSSVNLPFINWRANKTSS